MQESVYVSFWLMIRRFAPPDCSYLLTSAPIILKNLYWSLKFMIRDCTGLRKFTLAS